MSRRDTIIIAVLVNAALLMILFATAMRSDSSEKEVKKAHHREEATLVHSAEPIPTSKPAFQEDILNEFISAPTLAESKSEKYHSYEELDLGLISAAEPIVSSPPAPVPVEEIKVTRAKEEAFVQVTVKKGDFLEKIAKNNNTTVAAIMKVNNLGSTQLKVGQVLKIPLDEKKVEIKKPSTPSSIPSEGEFYVVKEGDNPWLIASRNKIKLEELLRLNGLDDQKAKKLRPGDRLKIR